MLDVLTDVLNSLRLRSSLFSRTELSPPWGMHFTPQSLAVFHVLDRGNGWLKLDDESTFYPLVAGEVVVLPHGDQHSLVNDPASPLVDVPLYYDGEHDCESARYGEHPTHVILCGTFHFENPNVHPLLSLLPKVIRVLPEQNGSLTTILAMIASESMSTRPGAETILRRLTDILFVHILRTWIENQAEPARGWLGALRDPQIGQALGLIHSQSERAWTVGELARAVALSRTVFSTRFTKLVSEPPVQYLTRWRIRRAVLLLNDPALVLKDIAQRAGYGSEMAFSKAFKREMGVAPGQYRRSLSQSRINAWNYG